MQAGAPAKPAAKSGQTSETVNTFKQEHSLMGRSFFGEVGKTWLRITNSEGGYMVEAWQPNWDVYFINRKKKLFCRMPYKEVIKKNCLLKLSTFSISGSFDISLQSKTYQLRGKTFCEYMYPGEETHFSFLNDKIPKEKSVYNHFIMKTVKLPGTAKQAEVIYSKTMSLPAAGGFPVSLYGHLAQKREWEFVTREFKEAAAQPPSIADLKGLQETKNMSDVIF
ncbi:MAG TPA: hypothetical protein PKN86_06045, partial [Candidatus Obscuribacter sp.]|nr:hypothetical protein [Candidatus Obscuribacter sp.]